MFLFKKMDSDKKQHQRLVESNERLKNTLDISQSYIELYLLHQKASEIRNILSTISDINSKDYVKYYTELKSIISNIEHSQIKLIKKTTI